MKYQYECIRHGTFEVTMSIKDHKNTHKCPQCPTICKQVITGGQPPIFKGSDWASKKIPDWKPNNDWKGKGEAYK